MLKESVPRQVEVEESNQTPPLRNKNTLNRKDATTSQPLVHPQQIIDHIEQLQNFIREVWNTSCYKCSANITSEIDIKATINQWFNNSRSGLGDTSICTRKCGECRAVTCLGCGEAPEKSEPRMINDHYISWCCLNGRLLTLWMVLCRFDMVEIELRALSQRSKQSNQARRSGHHSSRASGVGYAKSDPSSIFAGESWTRSDGNPTMQLKREDPHMESFIKWIMDVVTFALPGSQAKDLPPALLAMLELSLLIDKTAELLRNDSLDNIMDRLEVHLSALNLVEKFGAHQVLLRLVQDDRYSKNRSSGLLNMSFPVESGGAIETQPQLLVLANDSKDQSLAKRLENLAIQSELVLGVPSSEADLKCMCRRISSVYNSIKKEEHGTVPKSPREQWSQFHKTHSLTFNDAILDDFVTLLQTESRQIERQLAYSRTITDRNKRILSECANMRTSLDDGTFVIVAESRPDMMKALMVGPEDTPYANGLFEFDILLPADYPRSPPKIYIKLPYPTIINVNLHHDGKVCLSLLGTWFAGDAVGKWQPGISTILQCLISIRAMILISDNLNQNTPTNVDTSPGESASFDRSIQAQTVWLFMLNWLLNTSKRNGVWKIIIQKHFSMHRENILLTVKQWTLQNPGLREWTGQLAGRGVPKLGLTKEYVPGFHGSRGINLLQYLERNLPSTTGA